MIDTMVSENLYGAGYTFSNMTNQDTEKPFPMMQLPRELRDQIYSERLVIEKTSALEQSWYGLSPALLRVNKQMNQESSTILYDKNTWILFSMRRSDFNRSHRASGCPRLSKEQLELFAGKFALQVRLKTWDSTPPIDLLVPLPKVRGICMQMMREFPRQLDIILDFGISSQQRMGVQGTLADAFRDMRGVGKVTVKGSIPNSVGSELAFWMMSSICSIEELLDRAKAYQRRGEEEVALGHFAKVEEIYLNGYDYPMNAFDGYTRKWAFWIRDLEGSTPRKLEEMMDRKMDLSQANSFCKMKNGNPESTFSSLSTSLAVEGYFESQKITSPH